LFFYQCTRFKPKKSICYFSDIQEAFIALYPENTLIFIRASALGKVIFVIGFSALELIAIYLNIGIRVCLYQNLFRQKMEVGRYI